MEAFTEKSHQLEGFCFSVDPWQMTIRDKFIEYILPRYKQSLIVESSLILRLLKPYYSKEQWRFFVKENHWLGFVVSMLIRD